MGLFLIPISASAQAVFSPLFEEVQQLNGKWGGECAYWLRKFMEWKPLGDAKDWKPNSQVPIIGGAVLFDNHVALVIGTIGEQLILVESNFDGKRQRILVGRTIAKLSPLIKGYYYPSVLAMLK